LGWVGLGWVGLAGWLVKITNYEAPHCTVFFILLLLCLRSKYSP
jgi:hypothetical protein